MTPDQLNLFDEESNQSKIDDILTESETLEKHSRFVKLALSIDLVRRTTADLVEVLQTYERINNDEENILIPRPYIENKTANKLYFRMKTVYENLKLVKESMKTT